MAAAIVPISPASNSGRKWLARTFLRSRLSYKNIGKSKCRSAIPWRWRRVIRSSVDSDAGFICFQRSLTDGQEQCALHGKFWGAQAACRTRFRRQAAGEDRLAACAPQTRPPRLISTSEYPTVPEARLQFPLPRLDVLAAASRKRGDRATRLFPTEQAREPKLCNALLT